MVIKGILPIAIKLENLLESCNKAKEGLNGTNLDDNINQVTKEADLSPNQIEPLKEKQGRAKKKNQSSSTSLATMHTKSHTAKTKSR